MPPSSDTGETPMPPSSDPGEPGETQFARLVAKLKELSLPVSDPF